MNRQGYFSFQYCYCLFSFPGLGHGTWTKWMKIHKMLTKSERNPFPARTGGYKSKKLKRIKIEKSDKLYKFKNLISYTNENLMDFRGKPGFGNFTKLPEREPS